MAGVKCLCAGLWSDHLQSDHEDGTGRCTRPLCGCRVFRARAWSATEGPVRGLPIPVTIGRYRPIRWPA